MSRKRERSSPFTLPTDQEPRSSRVRIHTVQVENSGNQKPCPLPLSLPPLPESFAVQHDFPLPRFPLTPLAPLYSTEMDSDFETLSQAAYPAEFGGASGGTGGVGQRTGTSGMGSPPLVGLSGMGGFGSADYPSKAHHDSPLSPTSAFGTPALSSSHDTLASLALSTPQTTFGSPSPSDAPQVYLSPSSPTPSAGQYHATGGNGLGLGDLAGLEHDLKQDIRGKGLTAPQSPDAPRVSGHRRAGSTTRPPEVSRKGEELGLSLGDFDMLETLGTGTFGRVLLCRLRPDPQKRPTQTQPHYFAMKVLEKNTIVRLRQVEHVNSERATLAWVRHPFVVNLFCTFQDEANLYLLLEYVQGGELFSHLRRAGRFSADVARFYGANLVLALDNLHKQDILYRDLKPENLLIDATGHLKMTDFGFAKYVPERTFTLCGTPEYLAPEIITATGHGSACDWWALGVLLFELLAGYPPFFADNPLEIYEKILQGRFGMPAHIDPLARDLIRRLLTADLSKRLGNLKGGAQDVKSHPWFEGVDWEAVERKEIRAPIIPLTSVPGDCSNFERFPQTSIETMPGVLRALSQRKYGFEAERGEDAYGYLFPSF